MQKNKVKTKQRVASTASYLSFIHKTFYPFISKLMMQNEPLNNLLNIPKVNPNPIKSMIISPNNTSKLVSLIVLSS